MFDKKELSTLLGSLETDKNLTMLSCISCDIVEYREVYTKTNYCKTYCRICKDIKEVDALIFKIKELLK